VRRTRVEAGVVVVVVVALVALAAGSFQRDEEPSAQVRAPSTTPAPSTTVDRPELRPLAGVPLTGPTRLRLLVASEPRPFVVDLDQASVQPVTGLPIDGERVVSVLPVGEHCRDHFLPGLHQLPASRARGVRDLAGEHQRGAARQPPAGGGGPRRIERDAAVGQPAAGAAVGGGIPRQRRASAHIVTTNGPANARTLATSRTATPTSSSKVGMPLKVCTTVTVNSPR
jgi:hypothetical protein